MFEYSLLFIFLIIFTFLTNFILCYANGGLKNNILNIFTNVTFIIYLFITPVAYFIREYYVAFEMNVKDYYGIGLFQILLHLFFYNLAYFFFIRKKKKNNAFSEPKKRFEIGVIIEKKIIILFLISYLAVFVNTLSVGINLIDVFTGKFGDPTMGLRGGSYYIQNLADSLIAFIVIAYYFKIKKRYFLIMLFFSLPLFLILGFRYRIILSFFGIILIYIYDKGLSFRAVIKYIFILLVALYSLLLLTHNRYAIYMQKYEDVTYDMNEFDYDVIFDQARGSLMDFAVYQYIDKNIDKIDYGETMVGYIFIKMVPSFFFKNETKPYPPPQFPIIDDAINGTRDNGEAVTSLGGSFIAFYYPGIYIMAFLLGYIIAKLQNRFEYNYLSMITGIIINLALFQWISRGYFPQEVDHLAYMLFPILLLKIFIKKKIISSIKHA
jgi:oligosaccharide repeat unit polymerase